LHRCLKKIGLGLVFKDKSISNIDGILHIEGENYDVNVDPNSLENISGRYGPNKDRIIRIPNYERLRIYGDYVSQRVYDAVSDMSPFNWIINGLTGDYCTTLHKMSTENFDKINIKLKEVSLELATTRSTYFEISYVVIPTKSSGLSSLYSRTHYV